MIRAVPVELPDALSSDKPPTPPRAVVVDLTKSKPVDIPLSSKATPNVTPPKQLETIKLLSQPRKVVKAFLHAPSWKERLPYIYNGESLKPTIEEYYKKNPQGPLKDYTLEFINMERSHADSTLFYVFLFITKDLPDGFPLILRTENKALKVDWEIFAEFHDLHFKNFSQGDFRGPHPLRIMMKRASYWGPDKDKFTDLKDYLCYGVSSPLFSEEGEFAFIKKGTPLANKLEKGLQWGQRPNMVIAELKKVKFAHSQDHLVIKNVITYGWFSPPQNP